MNWCSSVDPSATVSCKRKLADERERYTTNGVAVKEGIAATKFQFTISLSRRLNGPPNENWPLVTASNGASQLPGQSEVEVFYVRGNKLIKADLCKVSISVANDTNENVLWIKLLFGFIWFWCMDIIVEHSNCGPEMCQYIRHNVHSCLFIRHSMLFYTQLAAMRATPCSPPYIWDWLMADTAVSCLELVLKFRLSTRLGITEFEMAILNHHWRQSGSY